jgi:hypothetical protein
LGFVTGDDHDIAPRAAACPAAVEAVATRAEKEFAISAMWDATAVFVS